METKPLNGSAEIILWAMHLTEGDREKIRNCVHRYATPHTFCDKIKWVFYRAINAVKHLFGQSDWQVAEKVIQDRAWKMISPWFDSPLNPLPEKLKKQLHDKITDVVNDAAAGLLSTCLMAHEANAEVNDAFKKRVNELDLTRIFKGQVQTMLDEVKRERVLRMQRISTAR
jgi:hypothetical protein